jgi:hypothetical protein
VNDGAVLARHRRGPVSAVVGDDVDFVAPSRRAASSGQRLAKHIGFIPSEDEDRQRI